MIDEKIVSTHYLPMKKACDRRLPEEMKPENIGARLSIIRNAYGLSKSEIADMLDIERTYWSRFEGGKRAITNEVAYLLVDRFGVTFDFIILGRWDKLSFEVAEKLRGASS